MSQHCNIARKRDLQLYKTVTNTDVDLYMNRATIKCTEISHYINIYFLISCIAELNSTMALVLLMVPSNFASMSVALA